MASDTKDSDDTAKDSAPAPEPPKISAKGMAAMQGDDESPADDAGKVYELKDSALKEKYPEGVKFTEDGYPDFSPYAKESVTIDMKGDHYHDYKNANAAAGYDETPDDYIWHHHQDCKTMQLVPEDLHGAVPHTGGVSIIKHRKS